MRGFTTPQGFVRVSLETSLGDSFTSQHLGLLHCLYQTYHVGCIIVVQAILTRQCYQHNEPAVRLQLIALEEDHTDHRPCILMEYRDPAPEEEEVHGSRDPEPILNIPPLPPAGIHKLSLNMCPGLHNDICPTSGLKWLVRIKCQINHSDFTQ